VLISQDLTDQLKCAAKTRSHHRNACITDLALIVQKSAAPGVLTVISLATPSQISPTRPGNIVG